MENKLFKLLHAYHPNDDVQFEKADVLIYRDHLILTGYEKLGQPMSSFVHYQFHDLKLPGIYSTQIQMAEAQIPNSYKSAKIKNVFHCEPTFVLVPNAELAGINSYVAYTALYNEPADKLLQDDLDITQAKEFYNYPYRVYNDAFFAFEDAHFYSYHRPAFEVLQKKSINTEIFYVSIKSKFLEITCFINGELKLCNTIEMSPKLNLEKTIAASLKEVGMKSGSDNIFISCVKKEEKDAILESLKSKFSSFNTKAEALFGFPLNFWEIYGDLILCS